VWITARSSLISWLQTDERVVDKWLAPGEYLLRQIVIGNNTKLIYR
jgi:hypothetical protein